MSAFFASLLTAHVLLGLLGVMLSFSVSLLLLKREVSRSVIRYSWYAATAYVLSWLTGGYYYWFHYGGKVKPVILGGEFKWAHAVIMEAKEHAFLFLPVATVALAIALHCMLEDMGTNPALKRAVTGVSVAITVLAVIVTLSGVLITGGAR